MDIFNIICDDNRTKNRIVTSTN